MRAAILKWKLRQANSLLPQSSRLQGSGNRVCCCVSGEEGMQYEAYAPKAPPDVACQSLTWWQSLRSPPPSCPPSRPLHSGWRVSETAASRHPCCCTALAACSGCCHTGGCACAIADYGGMLSALPRACCMTLCRGAVQQHAASVAEAPPPTIGASLKQPTGATAGQQQRQEGAPMQGQAAPAGPAPAR
jgi:hypothetical protein